MVTPSLQIFPHRVMLVLLACASVSAQVEAAPARSQSVEARQAVAGTGNVSIMDLASVRRLFHELDRLRAGLAGDERVGAWTDVTMVLAAVTGDPAGSALTFEDLAGASTSRTPLMVRATAGTARRDTEADRLLALGYSSRETADVLSRRISQQALDTARRMIAVGQGHQTAANYLDSQYKAVAAFVLPRSRSGGTRSGLAGVFDAFIERYAALHRVESGLVRAIIATESDFNPAARSRAGAIGLMQLMPGTAKELGVNPFVPEQNIEGGVRYFAQLLRTFGSVELALIAYNAGPGFAERYARGRTGLYGETREYLRRVLARLGPASPGPVRQGAKPGRLVGHQ